MPKKEKNDDIVKKLEEEKEEFLSGWKRALADMENYKKQTEKDKEYMVAMMKAKVMSEVIPVAFNFDQAFKQVPEDQTDSAWIKGLSAIKQQIDTVLRENGVEKIKTVGETFDPNMHEAIMEQESDAKPGEIIQEVSAGYRLGDRVIKYPQVIVSKARG